MSISMIHFIVNIRQYTQNTILCIEISYGLRNTLEVRMYIIVGMH